MNPLEYTFFARFKNRIPDPGRCRIISIDWYVKRVEMTNGAFTYFPKFDEIEMEPVPEKIEKTV
jgi:hypothetical protein